MSSTQPEALHLADYLEFSYRHAEHSPEFIAAAELRRLYAEVDRLSYQLAYPDNFVKEPEQEPVAIADGTFNHNCPVGTLLYTAPPAQRTWVGLTDEDIRPMCGQLWVFDTVKLWVNVIEAKLKEKNT